MVGMISPATEFAQEDLMKLSRLHLRVLVLSSFFLMAAACQSEVDEAPIQSSGVSLPASREFKEVAPNWENTFIAASADISLLTIKPGVQVSREQTRDGRTMFMMNDGAAGFITCACSSNCSGTCTAEVGSKIGECSGGCEGLDSGATPCGSCRWLYRPPI